MHWYNNYIIGCWSLVRTSYAMLSNGIPWNIPLVTCIFLVYTLAFSLLLASFWPQKFKPCGKFGSDTAQKAQPTVERNLREAQCTMGRLGVIPLNCTDRWNLFPKLRDRTPSNLQFFVWKDWKYSTFASKAILKETDHSQIVELTMFFFLYFSRVSFKIFESNWPL